jgi:hypothetical protein
MSEMPTVMSKFRSDIWTFSSKSSKYDILILKMMTETLPWIHLSLVGYNPKFPWKLCKEEINENIRFRKLPSVLLLQVPTEYEKKSVKTQ